MQFWNCSGTAQWTFIQFTFYHHWQKILGGFLGCVCTSLWVSGQLEHIVREITLLLLSSLICVETCDKNEAIGDVSCAKTFEFAYPTSGSESSFRWSLNNEWQKTLSLSGLTKLFLLWSGLQWEFANARWRSWLWLDSCGNQAFFVNLKLSFIERHSAVFTHVEQHLHCWAFSMSSTKDLGTQGKHLDAWDAQECLTLLEYTAGFWKKHR